MKILIAGATGAIGKPLIKLLSQQKHAIFGITQSSSKSEGLKQSGAKPVIFDDPLFTKWLKTSFDD